MDEITRNQGWSNHDTWHVNMLMTNTRAAYYEMKAALPTTEEKARTLFLKHFPNTLTSDKLDIVNWHELTEDWNIYGQ